MEFIQVLHIKTEEQGKVESINNASKTIYHSQKQ